MIDETQEIQNEQEPVDPDDRRHEGQLVDGANKEPPSVTSAPPRGQQDTRHRKVSQPVYNYQETSE